MDIHPTCHRYSGKTLLQRWTFFGGFGAIRKSYENFHGIRSSLRDPAVQPAEVKKP